MGLSNELTKINTYYNNVSVGNSIKYVTMRLKLYQNHSAFPSVLEAVISIINKVSALNHLTVYRLIHNFYPEV